MQKTCLVCSSNEWLPLPDPDPYQSVTTSSRIVLQPLGKSACKRCGLVQRVRADFLGLTSYYEEDYASYYGQPGADIYHLKRYQELIDWMNNFLIKEFTFHKVLDVGCGQGWAMDVMLALFPDIDIYGIEPSEFNSSIAEKKGHKIIKGKIEDLSLNEKFDLIYSNNVIQHVNNPVKYINNIKDLANDDTVIIMTCPNGLKAHIELMFSDHNYSFLPSNLNRLGKDTDFETVIWGASRDNPSLPPAQLLLLTNNGMFSKQGLNKPSFLQPDLEAIAAQKINYLNSLKSLNNYINNKILDGHKVYNFGASFWTSILAAYCSDYWAIVEACVVDNKANNDEFMGKKIITLDEITEQENAIVVLGTNPATHEALCKKMSGYNIIKWDNIFKY